MWAIIKSEIEYNLYWLTLLLALPISFTIFGLNDIRFFEEIPFMKKYFWNIYVAFGFYLALLIIWSIRAKEKRDRSLALLPVKKTQIIFTRLFFGVIPFLAVICYVELLHLIFPENWHEYIREVNVQLVAFFIFFSYLSIVLDLNFYDFKSDGHRIVTTIIVIILLVTPTILVFYSDMEGFLPQMGVLEGRIYFYLLTIIYYLIAARVFYNRKSYLA